MFPGFVLVDLYFFFMKMNSFVIYILFVIFVAVLLLTLNVLFSSHNPYMEKKTAFECGFHSFLGQNRTQFTISFFIFALLFLLFDLEILLIYPYTVSAYNNSAYGLLIMLIFFLLLTGGLVFELGKKALTIYSKQKQNSFII
jgi:NADH-ubiquinone oxidoreductase chain 3